TVDVKVRRFVLNSIMTPKYGDAADAIALIAKQIAADRAKVQLKPPNGTSTERQTALLATFRALQRHERDAVLRSDAELQYAVANFPAYMSGLTAIQHKDHIAALLERQYPDELAELRDAEDMLAVTQECLNVVERGLENERNATAPVPEPPPI